MPARVCKDCGLKFPVGPTGEPCPLCGGKPDWKPFDDPDPEWKQKVMEAHSEEQTDFLSTKEGRWRYERLVEAGYVDTQAMMLALDRAVDLHEAVSLRKKTDLAFAILS